MSCNSRSQYCVIINFNFTFLFNRVYFCLLRVSSFSFPVFSNGGCFVTCGPEGPARRFQFDDAGKTGGNLVLSQSATLFISETTNHIASLNNRNNRGLDVTDDEHRCKQISSQLLAAKPLTLKSTRCTIL